MSIDFVDVLPPPPIYTSCRHVVLGGAAYSMRRFRLSLDRPTRKQSHRMVRARRRCHYDDIFDAMIAQLAGEFICATAGLACIS